MTDDREAGFTVLEALIAFAITSLVLVSMFEIFSSVSRSERRASELLGAAALADDKLAQVGVQIALEPGVVRSGSGEELDWVLSIEEFDDGESESSPKGLYSVKMTVFAEDGETPVLTVATAKYRRPN